MPRDQTLSFECERCRKTFARRFTLDCHVRAKHSNSKPFQCSSCPKAFPRSWDCKMHESTHSGDNKCVCNGIFPTGTKAFVYNGCYKEFSCQASLVRHLKRIEERIEKANPYPWASGSEPQSGFNHSKATPVDLPEWNVLFPPADPSAFIPYRGESHDPITASPPKATDVTSELQTLLQMCFVPRFVNGLGADKPTVEYSITPSRVRKTKSRNMILYKTCDNLELRRKGKETLKKAADQQAKERGSSSSLQMSTNISEASIPRGFGDISAAPSTPGALHPDR